MSDPNFKSTNLSRLFCLCSLVFVCGLTNTVHAQSVTATLSGTVKDEQGAVIADAYISVIDGAREFERKVSSDGNGFFTVSQLAPSVYRIRAERTGFAAFEQTDVVLNVNDQRSVQIVLRVGQIGETVTVEAQPSLVDESPAVSTVVDRQFIENIPLNGRSLQSLITLAPGVVLTKSGNDQGQFSVNGQRADANYFTVDGVSANVNVPTISIPGQSGSGSLPSLTTFGGTNNSVSIDALQEFRIQTSTYAPEFGRSPGGQVQLLTRSGTNQFRGALFEYFRNDALDANDFFANRLGLRRPPLRQNQFGGTLGGPVFLPRFGEGTPILYDGRSRTFFFFSYEGLRLRQPQVADTTVPTVGARQQANVFIRPLLAAFPLPNGAELGSNLARFSASYSNPTTFDAASIRLDHTISNRLTLFGRYNSAPSETAQRSTRVLSNVTTTELDTRTLTIGATGVFSPIISNEARFNYSRSRGANDNVIDNFGGAATPSLVALSPTYPVDENSYVTINLGFPNAYSVGFEADNLQRQINVVDNLSIIAGKHALKFGVDYRRLTPVFGSGAESQYRPNFQFGGVTGALTGRTTTAIINIKDTARLLFNNYSFYGQDTWRATNRLTVTYGARYEVNPAPRAAEGRQPFVIQNLDDPANLSLAPEGTPIFKTTYDNIAPRAGFAYQLFQKPGRETVLRGGYGIFYDLGTGVITNTSFAFPFVRTRRVGASQFPLTTAQITPLPADAPPPYDLIRTSDPNLKLPYTHQFNFSVEQSLGLSQTITASYVGASGRRLLRGENILNPNAGFGLVQPTRNTAESDYRAAQFQFQRRLSRGLQAVASYTYAKSVDNQSDDVSLLPRSDRLDPAGDRSPSDFDVRHSFNAAVTYNIPTFTENLVVRALLNDWAVDGIFFARSATPVNVVLFRNIGFGSGNFRPDLVPGVSLYLDDPNAPGGKRFNNEQIAPNQIGPFRASSEARQGTLRRNALRGFAAHQLDIALRRRFNFTERFNLQFRAEAFNVFNRANFADPSGTLNYTAPTVAFPDGRLTATNTFGVSNQMLRSSLGGLSSLYQVGGPRSLQFALRLQF